MTTHIFMYTQLGNPYFIKFCTESGYVQYYSYHSKKWNSIKRDNLSLDQFMAEQKDVYWEITDLQEPTTLANDFPEFAL